MTRKAKLKQALTAIVDAMLPEDKPAPPPAPPSPPPDHAPYIKADMSMCCSRHDDEFERRMRPYQGSLVMPLHEWIKASEIARTRESNPFNMPSVGPALDAHRARVRWRPGRT
jgi:hypothetical protein